MRPKEEEPQNFSKCLKLQAQPMKCAHLWRRVEGDKFPKAYELKVIPPYAPNSKVEVEDKIKCLRSEMRLALDEGFENIARCVK